MAKGIEGIEATALRTRMAGGITTTELGARHTLTGWVHRRRDLGGVIFLDLRDRSGLLQLSIGPEWTPEADFAVAHRLGAEDVIQVEGTVARRPEGAENPDLPTGEVELRVDSLRLLNRAATPAIPVHRQAGDELPSEELRLRHRHLDLRRPELQRKLILRHRILLAARNRFDSLGFLEVETPILTKRTPEGARDYLVPSRIHPGEFYALPQSPQIYKQLLMTAGFDRYVQMARCFRDEDLRADRQPEFSQIDVEASFVDPEDIYGWIEGAIEAMAEVGGVAASPPFDRITWAEAMDRWGTDRPDLRWDLEITDWTGVLGAVDSPILRGAIAEGGRVRGFLLPTGAALSRKMIEGIEGAARKAGAAGLLWMKRSEEGLSGPASRFLDPEMADRMGLPAGGLLLLAAGPDRVVSPALAAVRAAVLSALELPKVRESAWLWVVDFPLFEAEDDGGLAAAHHPFVLPNPEDLHLLDEEPLKARGLAYDLVYNGSELGSGSLRIHDPALQRRILGILGLSGEEIETKFGFLLEALGSGAPPHGGIALGIDRIVKEFTGAASLRDVIAFPKTTAARALFEGAPSPVGETELRELHLDIAPGNS